MSHITCEEEIEGKQRKNEEIRGINNKKALEKQFTVFDSSFLVLSPYILTLIHLDNSWITLNIHLDLEKESKGKAKEKQGKAKKGWINNFSRRIFQVAGCMCNFLAEAHVFVYLVHFPSLAWVFHSLKMVSTLPFHFLDNHGVMGFLLG